MPDRPPVRPGAGQPDEQRWTVSDLHEGPDEYVPDGDPPHHAPPEAVLRGPWNGLDIGTVLAPASQLELALSRIGELETASKVAAAALIRAGERECAGSDFRECSNPVCREIAAALTYLHTEEGSDA